MADKDYKAFIVEGEAREPQIIDNISKVFFRHGNFKIITLPAGENIYMLWKRLKADDFDIWKEIVDVFAMRVSCLLGQSDVVSYEKYLETASPYDIYICEENETDRNRVFILSAFPEFLVDYFGMKLWKTCVKHTKNRLEKIILRKGE